MSAVERQNQIIKDFSANQDWEERYKKIIKLGKDLKAMPEDLKTEDLKVKGCQSQVWLHARLDEKGLIQFQGDSDAILVRGLVALLLKIYSGSTPKEILETPPDFLNALGFEGNLSPSRANGLNSMLKQIKFYAMAFQAMASRA